jgi:hypothetical protein
MADWLRRRLRGRDPYWSVDPHDLESTERVFLELWTSSAPMSRVRHALGEACGVLLREAWNSPPEQWHGDLLNLVGVIRPDTCRLVLRRVVEAGQFSPEQVRLGLDRRWLHAAAEYRWDAAAAIAAWRRLLRNPQYNVIAYRALAHDLELGIWHLPELYGSVEEAHRPFVLRQAVRLLLGHAQSDWAARLRWREGHLAVQAGLCGAIDEALRQLNRPPVFERAPAPVEAGQGARRETPPDQEPAARSADDGNSKFRGLAQARAA